jgi:hypothetical protein
VLQLTVSFNHFVLLGNVVTPPQVGTTAYNSYVASHTDVPTIHLLKKSESLIWSVGLLSGTEVQLLHCNVDNVFFVINNYETLCWCLAHL